MSHDITFLHELWDSVKLFVPKKDRIQASEAIVRMFDDNADITSIEDHLDDFDAVMKNAIVSHFQISSVDDDDDDNEYGDY